MPSQSIKPRAVAFFDGQNIYHAARHAFGYTYPNFDPAILARRICELHGWDLAQTRFYTGIPEPRDNAAWNRFWSAKLLRLSRSGVHVFSRPLRYRSKRVRLPNGTSHVVRVGEEKGVDVRIAIDVIRLAHRNAYDVALIFSQDQDLSEAAAEIRAMAREHQRWIKVASAFPVGTANRRGINGTDWIRISRPLFDACLDPHDYRRHAPGREAA